MVFFKLLYKTLLKAICWLMFRPRFKIFIGPVSAGELESSRIFLHFPKTLCLLAFPLITPDHFSVPKTKFLSLQKQLYCIT